MAGAVERATEERVRSAGGAPSTALGCGVSWASGAPSPRLLRLPGAGESAGATPELRLRS